ncbi:hypothetical protein AQUCO_00200001v1, partial [Aquilegia coerulea]
MGFFGMGGIGKTTLMKRINNELGKRSSDFDFDIVIWVVISKDVNMVRVQEEIGEKLGLSWPENVHLNTRAHNIFNVLISKKFLIFLDDIWKRIDLSIIGVPPSSYGNKSKIVFTTRSEAVLECLNSEASWILFQDKVGHATLNSDSDIPKLAEIVAPSIYDSLPNDTIRLCFLFCSLYPEDYSISVVHLIEQWIGEGYIGEFDDFDEALNTGHYIIGVLKDMCLLEEGVGNDEVKMHDVIRDLALWIACECGGEKDKFFVKAGIQLTQAPKAGKWPIKAEKISLISNSIIQLENVPQCPNLSTLLLSDNKRLDHIHNDFFLFIPALRFLDLSRTAITQLPTRICELFELEFLDLSSTKITSLPYEMRNLTKLKYLSIFPMSKLRIIPHIILKLEIQHFGASEKELQLDIDELRCLNQLKALNISFSNISDLERFLSNPNLAICARYLRIWNCKEITSLALSSSSSDLCLGNLQGVRELLIQDCTELKELSIHCNTQDKETTGLYENLEQMNLMYLPKLIIAWEVRNLPHPAYFRNLSYMDLYRCGAMVNLTWLLLIPNIQTLRILSDNESDTFDENAFSKLKFLYLGDLPKLWSICKRSALPFPALNTIIVLECPELRRLPLDAN